MSSLSNTQRFTYVNSYAAARGFGAGFPNFHEADYGYGVVHGTIFVHPSTYDFEDVLVSDYGGVDRFDVPAMMRAANDYAGRIGYPAAFPTFHIGQSAGGPVYGTILIKPGAVTFEDVKRSDLSGVSLSNVGGMFRAANDYAASRGFAAGFPTFHQANYGDGVVYGIQLLHSGTVMWRDVPRSELAFFGRAPKRWGIVLCTFRDLTNRPRPREFYEQYFTEAGAGTRGAFDYWGEVSYGGIDLTGSRVFGWHTMSRDRSELETLSDPSDPDSPMVIPPEVSWRSKVFDWGIDAARSAGDPIDQFDYKMVICPFGGHGAAGSKRVAIGFSGMNWTPGFILHEMGHGFGLRHSLIPTRTVSCDPNNDATPGAYCDRWDIMSFGNVIAPPEGGPAPNAVNRLKLDCLPDARVWKPMPGWAINEEVVIASLERADIDTWLAARVDARSPVTQIPPPVPSSFLVEYRQNDRWDRAFGRNAVFVHGIGANGRSLLVEPPNQTPEMFVGDSFTVPNTHPTIRVRVDAIDPVAHTATLRIWNSWITPPSLVRIVDIIANPEGPDVINGERVVIQNFSTTPMKMDSWELIDLANHIAYFNNFTLPAGAQVSVWTKHGTPDASNIYMNRSAAVWNNSGDTAILRNGRKVEISRYTYLRT